MKKALSTIIDINATLFAGAIVAASVCAAYTVVIPIGSVVSSLANKQKLSESWLELHDVFISTMHR